MRPSMTPCFLLPHCPPNHPHYRYDFVIVSYDLLKDVHEVLDGMNFQVTILDESHCIKNATVSGEDLGVM